MTEKLPQKDSSPPTGIYISPDSRGMISPMDFFTNKASLTFIVSASDLKHGANFLIFLVSFPDYHFEMGFANSEFYVIRNGDRITLKAESEGDVMFFAMWDTTFITLTYRDPSFLLGVKSGANQQDQEQKRTRTVQTVVTFPTNSVLQWARKANLLPVMTYSSSTDFFQTVLLSLQSIQDKILTSNMYNSFWDFQFDGSKIVSRKPKKETDIVKGIHGLLIDVAALKNYHIHPESPAAAGNLDFLVNGVLDNGKVIGSCVEFKHAHSPDLNHGLLKQLPAYMRSNGSEHGIYCPLYFKGSYFDLPEETILDMEFRLKNLAFDSGFKNINVITINLSRPLSPSRV
ncbi:MAG: hypothetical protein ACRD9Q_01820 [Nitrososphaeraceae archaeon]